MKNTRLVHWAMQVGIFLLKGAGWVAIGVVIGFIVSFFFRPTGRVDTFAFTETMLGVVITGLSIVGAFIIALQWTNLDRRIHEFDIKVKENEEFFDKQAERMQKIATDIDAYVKSTIDGYKENVDYLQQLLEENKRTSIEINTKVDDYKAFYEEKTKEMEKKQEELRKLAEEVIGLQKDVIEEATTSPT